MLTIRKLLQVGLILLGCIISCSNASAQYKLETCEDLKITEAHYGINTVETATCINPTKTFSPKGTLRNVNAIYSFPKVPSGAGVTFIVTKNDADGEYVRDVDYSVSPNHTTAYARFTINDPGKYYLRLVNHYNKAQVWAATEFTVGEDTVGPRAVGNTASGGGKVSICKEIDDAWKCVGESNQDPLNFPIKLNNRIAALRRSVETGDARPTNASYQIFKELSAELEVQLARLRALEGTELSAFNKLLAAKNLEPIRKNK